MATTLTTILTDPTRGLVPYLEANLEGEYQRLQIRPWTFNSSIDQRSGIRVVDASSKHVPGDHRTSRQVLLGRMFPSTSNINGTLESSSFAEQLDKLIYDWSLCGPTAALGLLSDINEINGTIQPTQDKGGQWWWVVIRSFVIQYRTQ